MLCASRMRDSDRAEVVLPEFENNLLHTVAGFSRRSEHNASSVLLDRVVFVYELECNPIERSAGS